MEQQSTADTTTPRPAEQAPPGTQSVTASAERRWRWKLFPPIWILGLLSLPSAAYALQLDRGVMWVLLEVALLLIVVGLIIWFAVASPFRPALRWGTALVLLVALYALGQTVDIVNDGDMRPVAVRFPWQQAHDAKLSVPTPAGKIEDWTTTPRDYPRFLGIGYWAEVAGVRLSADWQSNPPQELWRRPIGGGWSAFAIVGDYAVTQEQRGEHELVTCYRVSTGEIVWTHADVARFDPETMSGGLGGIGPRATPTVVGEHVITQGATGIVNCLDALTGQVIWSHDTLAEQGADNLMWGKSGSPLVVDDMVVINVGAPAGEEKQQSYEGSLVAYDVESGEIRWAAGHRTTAYPSPVLATFDGVPQILQINENFLTAHRASDGEVLWEHDWPGSSSANASCSQPVPLAGDRLFLSRGYGDGASLLEVKRESPDKWYAQPLWQPPVKRVMKTKFSNVVVRDGFVYGLDETIMQCVELETGKSMWKKRRSPKFGHGQIMLIGDHILVLTEIGELVLLKCTPDRYHEVANLQALDESDVTWNNPAFSPPYLLIRNSREAACYRLPLAN